MATAINTGKVMGRRSVRFNSPEDIARDVEQLAKAKEIKGLGNWSAGQVFEHLAISFNNSIDGFPDFVPFYLRFVVRTFFKKKLLYGKVSPGFKVPAKGAALLPPPVTQQQGLDDFRKAFKRFQTETKRSAHPALGQLTPEEWKSFHCRHSEMHLSFLIPAQG